MGWGGDRGLMGRGGAKRGGRAVTAPPERERETDRQTDRQTD